MFASTAVIAGSLMGRSALADGGIPGSLAILLPADQPQKIALATNFGLILSEDAGATWLWTCEQVATTSMANMYAVGPPAVASGGIGDRFYALSPLKGLAISDDESCTWRSSAGALAGLSVSDFFVDPTDPAHVLAAAVPAAMPAADGGAAAASVFVSTDGGATFLDTPIFTAPAGAALVGIEIARSNPSVVYLAYYLTGSSGRDPVLMRSSDGGAHWSSIDLAASVGSAIVRILAVDPANSDLVYLRVTTATQEAIAITRDGGTTFSMPLTIPKGTISAFARLQSGTVLVGALVPFAGDGGGTMGAGFRSTDGATSFQTWTPPGQPHLIGLAERIENGQSRLYLSGKNYSDGWALAVSGDEGATLTPLMSYDQVKGIKPCVQQTCLDTCNFEEMQAVWTPAVCGGAATTGGGGGGGAGSGSGCHCGLDPTQPLGGAGLAVMGLAALAWTRRSRWRC
jgi:MYXO-CTERM domain-containing protein